VVEETRKVAAKLGCGEPAVFTDATQLKQCLRSKTVAEIQRATNNLVFTLLQLYQRLSPTDYSKIA
jgi:hypothetical protein